MKSSIVKYIFIIFVIILIIVTCFKVFNSKNNEEQQELDKTSKSSVIQTDLRLAISGYDALNPLVSNNKNVQEITKIIYEPLVTLDSNLKLQCCLAKEIAKKDDNTYIIKLRDDVCFHDGTNLSAEDVKFTIDTIKTGINSIYSSNLAYVSSLNIIDENTISISIDKKIPFFEYYLTFPIMSAKYFENEDFANSEKRDIAIGTGPFTIDNIENNVIKLVRNENYWNKDKIPMVKEIYINVYDAIGNAYEAFKSGDIDILNVSTVDIDKYIGTLGHIKMEYKTRNYDFISFNTQNKIFSDPAVRKALSLSIDKSAMVANLGQGYTPSNFSFDMGSWLYSDKLNIESDLEQAKQILINAGWEYKNNYWAKNIDGKEEKLEFTIIVNENNNARKTAAQNILEQLANFGINISIKELSANKYANTLENKNYDVIITGIECGYSPNLETFFGENNIANYSNNEIKEILIEAYNTTEENTVKEKYNRLYEIYLEEAPYFGLYRETDYIVYNQSLVGNLKPNVFNIFTNIEKWYRQ